MGGDAVLQVGPRPAQDFRRQYSSTWRGGVARLFQDQLLRIAYANAEFASKYGYSGDGLHALSG